MLKISFINCIIDICFTVCRTRHTTELYCFLRLFGFWFGEGFKKKLSKLFYTEYPSYNTIRTTFLGEKSKHVYI